MLRTIRDPDSIRLTTADVTPPAEFVRSVVARVELQVAAGNFPLAERIITTAAEEWQEELRQRNAVRKMLPVEKLSLPLAELQLPPEVHSALDHAGCLTIADGIQALNRPANSHRRLGPAVKTTFYAAARKLGVPLPE